MKTDLSEVKLCMNCCFYNADTRYPTCSYYQPTGDLKASRSWCLGKKHRTRSAKNYKLAYLRAEVERTLQAQSDATDAYIEAIDNLNDYMKDSNSEA